MRERGAGARLFSRGPSRRTAHHHAQCLKRTSAPWQHARSTHNSTTTCRRSMAALGAGGGVQERGSRRRLRGSASTELPAADTALKSAGALRAALRAHRSAGASSLNTAPASRSCRKTLRPHQLVRPRSPSRQNLVESSPSLFAGHSSTCGRCESSPGPQQGQRHA